MSETETMVERVARAIYAKADPSGKWEARSEMGKGHYIAMARAAIAAMREPTEGMVHAMTALAPTWDDETSRRKWSAAIDAALKE